MKGFKAISIVIFSSAQFMKVESGYQYYDYDGTDQQYSPQTSTSSWNVRPTTSTWKIQPPTPQRQFLPPAPPAPPACTPGVCFELGNYPGGNGGGGRRPNVATKEECQQLCRNDPNCCHWSHYGPNRNIV